MKCRYEKMQLDNIVDVYVYGEDQANDKDLNLRGNLYQHYDTGGLEETTEYYFKYQPKQTERWLASDYKNTVDWNVTSGKLETTSYVIATQYDALGRIKLQTAPDASDIKPSYNERGLLGSEDVDQGSGDITHLAAIEYDAKGQRIYVEFGNGVYTDFTYDENTYRLVNMVTTKPGSPDEVLQDLHYWYDAVGNITWKQDDAFPARFYDNAIISAANEYTYDALYRLTEATGRENQAAISFGAEDNYDNAPHLLMHGPTDTMQTQEYTQTYTYDEVGNILSLQHSAGTGSYTRNYEYDPSDNRLKRTRIGAGPPTYNYSYHTQHGFITQMPHLPVMQWNWKEELSASSKQVVAGGQIPETTYYQYDSKGKRLRKITENFSPGPPPTQKDMRVYIEGYEYYENFMTSDVTETLSLIDGGQRFVMMENSSMNGLLTRYIHPNHQGSCTLETDDNGDIITYEEYHPFGTTAYQATNSNITAAAKRYRYTWMERDDETGLNYHNARYYIPWLGRWLNPDPIGIGDGVNVYSYCWNNPVTFMDVRGTQTDPRLRSAGSFSGGSTAVSGETTAPHINAEQIQRSVAAAAERSKPSLTAATGGAAGSTPSTSGATQYQSGSEQVQTQMGTENAFAQLGLISAPTEARVESPSEAAAGKIAGGIVGLFATAALALSGVGVAVIVASALYSLDQTAAGIQQKMTNLETKPLIERGAGAFGRDVLGMNKQASETFGAMAHVGIGFAIGGTGISKLATPQTISTLFKEGRIAKASELVAFGERQGWRASQSATGPLKFFDESGVNRMTIKAGSSRAPGSNFPHVEFRNEAASRIDPFGREVNRRTLDNHIEIIYDIDR